MIELGWEKACKEFLKGCTCVDFDNQEECPSCLRAFCNELRSLAKNYGYAEINIAANEGNKMKWAIILGVIILLLPFYVYVLSKSAAWGVVFGKVKAQETLLGFKRKGDKNGNTEK